MALEDTVCTLVPYFTVQDGKLDEFKELGEQMVQRISLPNFRNHSKA